MSDEDPVIDLKSVKYGEEIVKYFAENPYERPSDALDNLGEELGVSRSNFYNVVTRLCERGLLEKQDGGGRSTLYKISDTGAEALRNIKTSKMDLTSINNFNIHQFQSMLNARNYEEARDYIDNKLEQGSTQRELSQMLVDRDETLEEIRNLLN